MSRCRGVFPWPWNRESGSTRRSGEREPAESRRQQSSARGGWLPWLILAFGSRLAAAGVPQQYVSSKKAVDLPGFFRPTKEWDILVVRDSRLLAAIEAKSQVGPSFGNNFNNRILSSGIKSRTLLTRWKTDRSFSESPMSPTRSSRTTWSLF
ncbi:MAG: hypothetical protein KA118_06600 [Verrucomicrobia bacterium]|nr:hypothetical protein [Verrucomicrobiota bacterium]